MGISIPGMKEKIDILVFSALKIEIKDLVKQYKPLKKDGCNYYDIPFDKKKVIIFITGVGKDKAISSSKKALDLFSPNIIINVGSCGALDSDLHSGSVILPAIIKGDDESSNMLSINNDFYNQINEICISKGYDVSSCALFTSNNPLKNEIQKRSAFVSTQCRAVDMESYWIGRQVEAYTAPFIVLRVVLDELEDELPEFYSGTICPRISISNLAKIPDLIIKVRKVSKTIKDILVTFISKI